LELATTDAATENVTLSFENATGYYNKNGGFSTYSGVTTAKVSVVPHDRYLLTTRNYYNAAVAVFFDANDSFVSGLFIANNTSPLTDLPVTVPANASYMLIQRLYGYSPTLLKKITGVTNKPVKSILKGKNVTLIGDSITEKNSTANINWALWMYDWCGANVQNLGASGTGFIAGDANPYHNRISRISNPDIIGIALSFNDMSNTIEDLTTAAETFFDDLITAYPATPIICYVQSPWSAYRPGVEKSDQWLAALRNVCVTRGVPFYDEMYYGSALRPWLSGNRSVYYMHDGEGSDGAEDWVHPNSEGHKIIARHLYPLFEKNVVATGLSCVIG
jgi:lysophospholipase L1-like esterase